MDKINEHLQGSTFLLGMCLLLCVPWLQFQNKDKFSRKKKKKNGKARDLIKKMENMKNMKTTKKMKKTKKTKKHRKNCECCPVSQLIVRSQRLS